MSNDLQNKLFHFEADPPKEAWNKIADALDADTEESFPQRLFSYEATPPPHIWSNIENSLEETEPAIKVVPITRYKKPLRYMAAAASIIAVIFLVATFSDNQKGAGSVVGSGTTTITTTNQSSILPLDKPQVIDISTPEQKSTLSLQASSENEEKEQPVKKKTLAFIRAENVYRWFAFSENFIPRKATKETFFDFSDQDAYMVYSDGNGNAMKLPKKLYSLVHCEDGDYSCQERIKTLQQKIASTATTTDFGGVLEILRQLQ